MSDFFKKSFLIAMPGLMDPNFSQTVTCICEHTSMGAFGLVINRTHSFISVKDLFTELKIEYQSGTGTSPVHIGGPVHTEEVFILHGPPLHWEGSILLSQTLAMSNTRDVLTAIAAGSGPASFLIALGCAGWGPGQLEAEIKSNVWLTGPLNEKIIFNTPVEFRWEESVKLIGIDPS
ncbi:MAG: YqgE/AlgH family protein, partial [Thermodesulfobacteriota bacterium]